MFYLYPFPILIKQLKYTNKKRVVQPSQRWKEIRVFPVRIIQKYYNAKNAYNPANTINLDYAIRKTPSKL
jgi:hypothetical protein